MKTSRWSSFAFAMFLSATPALAQSVRTFVSTSGVDNASCLRVSPCRTFAAAVAAVNPAGEVVALDSGGYGPFIIDQAVTVLAPEGIHAAIAPTSGAAITVNASGAQVQIRNLVLNGQGIATTHGLSIAAVDTLQVLGCTISNFEQHGINMNLNTNATLLLADSFIRDNDGTNVSVTTAPSTVGILLRATISRSHITGGGKGIYVGENGRVMVRDSLIGSASTDGIQVENNLGSNTSRLVVDGTTVEGCIEGIRASGASGLSFVVVTNSVIHTNVRGIRAGAASIIRIGGNTITQNTGHGIFFDGGIVATWEDNHLAGNALDTSSASLTPITSL